MQYRVMPKNKELISILGFGCMRFETTEKGDIVEEKALELLEYAFENGINLFDTAFPYHKGQSETLLGKFLQTIERKKVYIATKLPSWLIKKPEDFSDFLKQQLDKLQTDYIDFYFVHSVNKGLWKNLGEQKLLSFLDRAKSDGLIKNAGFSFHDDYRLFKRVVDAYSWDLCLIMLNYLDTHYQAGLKGCKYASEKGLGVMIMEPLRGGKIVSNLTPEIEKLWSKSAYGYNPVERALHWLWNLPKVNVVLSGMSDMKQLKENIRIASAAQADYLPESEIEIYKKVRRTILKRIQIPCTGCRYCLPCPAKLPIPDTLGMYNEAFMFNDKDRARREYQLFFPEEIRADKCTSCAECLPKCPRQIDIPASMKTIKEFFGG